MVGGRHVLAIFKIGNNYNLYVVCEFNEIVWKKYILKVGFHATVFDRKRKEKLHKIRQVNVSISDAVLV